MRFSSLLAAVLVVSIAYLSTRAEAQECQSAAAFTAMVEGAVPGAHFVTMSDKDRTRFLANYNAEPPETNWNPDTIVYAIHPLRREQVFVVFVTDGCVIGKGVAPTADFQKHLSGESA